MPFPKRWTYSLGASLLLLAPFDFLGSLGMDIYLPAVPRMPVALDTTPDAIQLSLSLYLFVLGSGQLLFGPLSDWLGRRPVLLGGAMVFTGSSIAAAATSSAPIFVTLRIAQAMGAAAALVATYATVRDVYAGRNEGTLVYGLLGSMLAFVPAFGPILGAEIDSACGWRAIFGLLAALGFLAATQAFLWWPETRPATRVPAGLPHVREILTNAPFWIYTLGFSAAMGTFFVYFSTAARVLVGRIGLTPLAFSLLFATVALVMIVTSRLSIHVVAR